MTGYDITTEQPSTTPGRSAPDRFQYRAGALCVAGAVVAVVGATLTATLHSSVSDDLLSYPFTPRVFRFTEVLWTLTHALTLLGVIGLARWGLAAGSRLGRVGTRVTLVGMALLVPAELAFAFIANAKVDSTADITASTVIGLAATLSGLGFTLVGIAVLRDHSWPGWGGYTPLLCGLLVLAVLLPVQAAAPDLFLWPIAVWNVGLALFGAALMGRTAQGV